MNSVFTQAKRHLKITRNMQINVLQKSLIVIAIFGVVLYTMFFTTTPLVHDYFHELRHGLMMIPCH